MNGHTQYETHGRVQQYSGRLRVESLLGLGRYIHTSGCKSGLVRDFRAGGATRARPCSAMFDTMALPCTLGTWLSVEYESGPRTEKPVGSSRHSGTPSPPRSLTWQAGSLAPVDAASWRWWRTWRSIPASLHPRDAGASYVPRISPSVAHAGRRRRRRGSGLRCWTSEVLVRFAEFGITNNWAMAARIRS
ncbi:hypothetical protein BT67DRAFT_39952 [Trichocladium antarcticum]|uniref:Uncharacterized protein n=1 Tax=Trichocladium antarcticum TaxID=1450529 RepID=A0AAN6UIT4_9PEZI|nr:hypothetical protein BT67DRAFT_39952 [Trichocladium antarcticum]